jgi:hypothetical protein
MLGNVRSIEAALGAGVGAHDEVLLGRVDRGHRAARAVVDRALAVVATRDDPITNGELVATDVDALVQAAVAFELGADERVEALAALVVTHDQHGLPPGAGGLLLAPRRDRGVLAATLALRVADGDVHVAVGGFLGQVVGGVAAADLGQELALARIALAHHLAQLV